jgi:hypothetical protein
MSYVLESSEYPHSEKMIVIAREKTSPSALPMIMLSKTIFALNLEVEITIYPQYLDNVEYSTRSHVGELE